MKKLFSILVISSILSTATVRANESNSSMTGYALVTIALVASALLKTDSNVAVAAALEEREISGAMTPVLRSFVDDIKATAALKGLLVSDEDVISSLELAALN